MDVITKDVRALAKKELVAANRRFRMFASPHEGYHITSTVKYTAAQEGGT